MAEQLLVHSSSQPVPPVRTETVFKKGQKYKVLVSGTGTYQNDSVTQRYDAFHCYQGCSQGTGLHDYLRVDGSAAFFYDSKVFSTPAYRSDHRYSFTYDTAEGVLEFTAFPFSWDFVREEDRYSGTFNVDITAPGEAAPKLGRVTAVTRKVEIQRRGSAFEPAEVGTELRTGDKVHTGFKSKAELEIGGHKMTVEPMTLIELQTTGATTRVFLRTGRATADMLLPHADRPYFQVRTPTATASVRGTVFSVSYDPLARLTITSVKEGVVDVDPVARGLPTATLTAGKEVATGPKSQTPVTGIGKAGTPRGAVSRARARDLVLAFIAKKGKPCKAETRDSSRTAGDGIRLKAARGGWHVTTRVVGRGLKGIARWKVKKSVKPANPLARRVSRGCRR